MLTPLALNIFARVKRFFRVVPGAIKNHLNVEELRRISLTSLLAGGGIFGVLQAVLQNTSSIVPAPQDAALAGAMLTVLLEVYRRLGQGEDPPRPPNSHSELARMTH
ncbi:MAG: hypothetical protein NVSMB9_28060 [Isosphaeraceae bacterium]